MKTLLALFCSACLALTGATAAQLVKTVNGVAIASVKTDNALAIASVKTINGVDNTSGGGGWTGTAVQVQARASTGASATTFTYNWSVTPTTGNDIWLFVASDTTISTPAGWTADVSNVSGQGQYIFHKVASSESSSVVLTLGAGNISASGVCVVGIEYAGLPASSFDKNSPSISGSGTTRTTGATGTLTQAAEIIFAAFCWSKNTSDTTVTSWSSSFTTAGGIGSTGSTTNILLYVGSVNVSATTTVSTTGTFGQDPGTTQAIIASYKHN